MFKADGNEHRFSQKEINEQFGTVFARAMNYQRKVGDLAPFRGMVETLKETKIDPDRLNLLVDASNGDQGALTALMKEHDIDPLDLDVDGEEYEATQHVPSENVMDIKEVNERIRHTPTYNETVDVVSNKWDPESRQQIMDNPEWLEGLNEDIASGLFAKANPIAAQLKLKDNGSKTDIEYYLEAGQVVSEKGGDTSEDQAAKALEQSLAAEKAAAKEAEAKEKAKKKKAAGSTTGSTTHSSQQQEADDEAMYDAWYATAMSKR